MWGRHSGGDEPKAKSPGASKGQVTFNNYKIIHRQNATIPLLIIEKKYGLLPVIQP
jgi:hypothetical protein